MNPERSRQLNKLTVELDEWLSDRRDELELSNKEEADAIVCVALYRVAKSHLGDYMELGAWLEAPFEEYNDQAAKS